MEELRIREGETREQYIYRCYDNRVKLSLTNKEVAEIINSELGTNFQESYLRGIYKNYSIGYLDAIEALKGKKEVKSKLSEITEAIGELDVKKQIVKNKTNQLGRIKRDLIKNVEIAEDIKDYIDNEVENFNRLNYEVITEESDNVLVVGVSDWHVGYVIDNYKGNSYNYKIAEKRLSKLLSEIHKEVRKNNVKKVIVLQAGDLTEGVYMRKNQSYTCEFNSNEQIVMAEELMYNFITSISELEVNVDLYSVGGNHQRGNGDKDANIEGDNNILVINRNLKRWFEKAKNDRVRVCEGDYKEDCCVFYLQGKKIKLKHGDKSPRNSKKFYDAEVSMNEERYDILIKGHDHNFNITSQNNGTYVITIGCLFGYNPYSVDKVQCLTHASQMLMLINKGEIEYIRDVNLQIN